MPTRNDSGMGALRTVSVMALVSVFCGVLVAGLLIPVASLLGMGTNSVADGFKSLPIALREQPTPERTVVKDVHGKTIAYFYKQNRKSIPLKKVAPVMQDAILSIEDYRFYEHGPIDVQGTFRAFVSNTLGNSVQGGSSITQQLVKMILVQQADTKKERLAAIDDSYGRKLRELKYAMAYEQNHTKKEILESYLNIAYFGDGAYGIDAAARHYFSVAPADLDARQAATLAGLVKNPVAYDPTKYPQTALTRRNTVLARMAELGKIEDKQAEKLISKPLLLKPTNYSNGCVSTVAPFYCDYVRRYLLQDPEFGDTPKERGTAIDTSGLTIHTNVDLRFQRSADRAVRDHVNPRDEAIGLLAMTEPGTGAVKAVAQSRPMGRDKGKGQTYINYTVPKTLGGSNGFQAGSTFKAFTLAAALDQGIAPSTVINSPQTLYYGSMGAFRTCGGDFWQQSSGDVNNSTGSGAKNMYSGTRESVNTFFIQLIQRTGICAPWTLAKDMGIVVDPPESIDDTTRTDQVPTFTLGITNVDPVTMASAYATFAARGVYCKPTPVRRIDDRDGEKVKSYNRDCERLLRKSTADTVNDILRGVQEPGGFGYTNAGLSIPSAAKTGTIQNQMGVAYAGYTRDLAVMSMVEGANDAGQPQTLAGATVGGTYIPEASGTAVAAPIWGEAVRPLVKYLSGRNFHPASNTAPSTVYIPPPDNNGGNGNNNGNNGGNGNNNGNNGGGNNNGNNGGNNGNGHTGVLQNDTRRQGFNALGLTNLW